MAAGTLTFRVEKATDLISRDWGGKSDPYCNIFFPSVGKTPKLVTPVIKNNLNPVWSDGATLELALGDLSGAITLQLWDKDNFSDEFLGEAIVPIGDLTRAPSGSNTIELAPREKETDSDVRKKGRGKLGSVTVSWQYRAPPQKQQQPQQQQQQQQRPAPTPHAQPSQHRLQPQSTRNLRPPVDDDFGQVQVSMATVTPPQSPAPNALTANRPPPVQIAPTPSMRGGPASGLPGTATVHVYKANGLLDRDWGAQGVSDPYVIVSDESGAKEYFRTSTIDDSLNPVWPADKGTGKLPLTTGGEKFKFTVWDKDTVGSDEFLGEIIVPGSVFLVASDERTFPLRSRPGEKEKKVLKQEAASGSLGTLTLKWVFNTGESPLASGAPSSANLQRQGTAMPSTAHRDRGLSGSQSSNTPLGASTSSVSMNQQQSPASRYPTAGQGQLQRGGSTVRSQANFNAPQSKAGSSLPGVAAVHIAKAEGLVNRDWGTQGVSDPYVVVYDHETGNQLFQTNTIDDSLDPVWKADLATAFLPIVTGRETFRFEVMDEDVGSDEFLGELILPASTFMTPQGAKALPLQKRDGEKEKKILKAESLGTLSLKWTFTVDSDTSAVAINSAPASFPIHHIKGITSGTIQMRVVKADNLLNVQTLGKIDPYIKVKNVMGEDVLTTKHIESTTDPVFPEESSKVVMTVSDAQGIVRLHVWNDNNFKDDFLGEVVIYVSEMMGTSRGQRAFPVHCREQEPVKELVEKAHKLGTVTVNWVFTPNEANMAPGRENIPSFPATLQCHIAGAVDLMDRDAMSKSDPYVIAFDTRNQEIMRTPTVNDCLKPRWPSAKSTIMMAFKDKKNFIKFQVWDENPMADSFLGECIVSAMEFGKVVQGQKTFPLCPREHEADKEVLEKTGSLGSLTLHWKFSSGAVLGGTPAGGKGEPPKLIRQCGNMSLQLVGANGLLNRDHMIGQGVSDPYVKVFVGGQEVGRTPVIEDKLDVVWPPGESFFKFFVENIEDPIVLEVWDKDLTVDDFLGKTLIVPNRTAVSGEATVKLVAREDEKEKDVLKNADNLGTLTYRWSFQPEANLGRGATFKADPKKCIRSTGKLTLRVVRCQDVIDLDNLGGGLTDVYVQAFYQDKVVLKTTTISDNLNPEWEAQDATGIFFVDQPDDPIRFQVWDEDMTTDEFVGELFLKPSQLELGGQSTFSLRPRKDESKRATNKNKDKLGTMTLSWTFEPVIDDATKITRAGKLIFYVTGANNFMKRDVVTQSDLIYTIRYMEQDVFKCTKGGRVVKKAVEWPQNASTAQIDIEDPNSPIVIQIWDHDTFSKNDFMGEAKIFPVSMNLQGTQAFMLKPRDNEPDSKVRNSKDKLGSVNVRWHFEEQNEPGAGQSVRGLSMADALQGGPGSYGAPAATILGSTVAPKLTAHIHSVINLQSMAHRQNPRTVITLVHEGTTHRSPPLTIDARQNSFTWDAKTVFTPANSTDFEPIMVQIRDAEDERAILATGEIAWASLAMTPDDFMSIPLQPVGELVIMLSVEERCQFGDVRVEIREAQGLIGKKLKEVKAEIAIAGQRQRADNFTEVRPDGSAYFGATFSARTIAPHDHMQVLLWDAATCVGRGSVAMGKNGQTRGQERVHLAHPTTGSPAGMVFTNWSYSFPPQPPLAPASPDTTVGSVALVEVVAASNLMLKDPENKHGKNKIVARVRPTKSNLKHPYKKYAATHSASPIFAASFEHPSAAGTKVEPMEIEIADEGAGTTLGVIRTDVTTKPDEGWYPIITGSKSKLGAGEVYVRHVIWSSPFAAPRDMDASDMGPGRVKGLTTGSYLVCLLQKCTGLRAPSQGKLEPYATLDFNGSSVQSPVGVVTKPGEPRFNELFVFPSRGRVVNGGRLGITVFDKDEFADEQIASGSIDVAPGQSGAIKVPMGPSVTALATLSWAEPGPHIMGLSEESLGAVMITVTGAKGLKPQKGAHYIAVKAVLSDKSEARTGNTKGPSLEKPVWKDTNTLSFVTDKEEPPKLVKLTVLSIAAKGGTEHAIGKCTVPLDKLGPQSVALQPPERKTGSRSNVGSLDIVLRISSPDGPDGVSDRSGAGDESGSDTASSDSGAPLQVLVEGPVGKPLEIELSEKAPLEALAKDIERNFAIAPKDLLFLHRNRSLNGAASLEENKVPGRKGVYKFQVTSSNKNNVIVSFRLPTGKSIAMGVPKKAPIEDIKAFVCRTNLPELKPKAIRLMCNSNELADGSTLEYFRITTGSVIEVLEKGNRRDQPKGDESGEESEELLTPSKGKKIKVQVEDVGGEVFKVAIEKKLPCSELRTVVDDDDPQAVLYFNGKAIRNERKTLELIEATNGSYFQFRPAGDAPKASKRGGVAGGAGMITVLVTDCEGNCRRQDVNKEDEVAVLRNLVDADVVGSTILLNRQPVKNERKTFAMLGARTGDEFELRDVKRRTKELNPQVEELEKTIDKLKKKLDPDEPKGLKERCIDLEHQLEDSERRNQVAADRIRELEEALQRNHNLLKRVMDSARRGDGPVDPVHQGRWHKRDYMPSFTL